MFIKTHIHKNIFRDSVYLMRLSGLIRELEGVTAAEVIIGTDHNKKFLKAGGLWTEEVEQEAGSNDLVIVVKAVSETAAGAAVDRVMEELHKEVERDRLVGDYLPRTFETALKTLPGANLALVSIPGRFVRREADRILDAGLHVMIFSDNVSLEDEVALKQKALRKGLLVMGPDCGTAIINGVPLAFANAVRQGSIGIVSAAGTGLQEVSSIIHNRGAGISQAVGTGGRDVKSAVGGIMMLQGLQALIDDPGTNVIVLVSKPPDPVVADKILAAASHSPKPVVVGFVGADPERIRSAGCEPAQTLKEAAVKAVQLAGGDPRKSGSLDFLPSKEVIAAEKRKLKTEQRFLRGLFAGGTLAYEMLIIARQALGPIHSNLALDARFTLPDVYRSLEHTIVDFGEDEFTQGRLHPMIDPAVRNNRIIAEAGDPGTAVIIFDLVLGYNAHQDPAGAALEAVQEAKAIAAREGRHIVFVVPVCGTDDDIQGRGVQAAKLTEEGVFVFGSNADAAHFVIELLGLQ